MAQVRWLGALVHWLSGTVLHSLGEPAVQRPVVDFYKITLFDLMYLDSSFLKKLSRNYFADTVSA